MSYVVKLIIRMCKVNNTIYAIGNTIYNTLC